MQEVIYVTNDNFDSNVTEFVRYSFRGVNRFDCVYYPYIDSEKDPVSLEDFWNYINKKIEYCNGEIILLYNFGFVPPEDIKPKRKLCVCHGTGIGAGLNKIMIDDEGDDGGEGDETFREFEILNDIDADEHLIENDYYIAISNMIKNELILFYGIPEERIVVLDYGVEAIECGYDGVGCRNNILSEVITVGYYSDSNKQRNELINEIKNEMDDVIFKDLSMEFCEVDLFIDLPVYTGGNYDALHSMSEGTPIIVTETGMFKHPIISMGSEIEKPFIQVLDVNPSKEDLIDAIEVFKKYYGQTTNYDTIRYRNFVYDNFNLDDFIDEFNEIVESFYEYGNFSRYKERFGGF
jgi:hypothetical protein